MSSGKKLLEDGLPSVSSIEVEAETASNALEALEADAVENPYSPLLEEARDNLLRIMHNTDNEKLSKEISVEILDRGGETKRSDANSAVMVNVSISDDDVRIFMATAQEVRKRG